MKTARATRERSTSATGAVASARVGSFRDSAVRTAPTTSGAGTPMVVVPPSGFALESQTRAAVVRLLMENGPITATAIGEALGLSAAGVRRHLDALIEMGDAHATAAPARPQRGRGRPAKRFQLTAAGRAQLRHGYDDLASAALRQLRELGGDSAIEEFARRRIDAILAPLQPSSSASTETVADTIAEALSNSGFAASTARVGNGVEICQHHCPVAHVAAEFPQLCEAEERAFARVLGTHVQRLATIANGDCVCTTHVPLRTVESADVDEDHPAPPRSAAQPAADTTRLRKEPA